MMVMVLVLFEGGDEGIIRRELRNAKDPGGNRESERVL